MESSFLDISTAPMASESECFCIYVDQLLPVSWGDANILIAQTALRQRLEPSSLTRFKYIISIGFTTNQGTLDAL